MSLKAHTSSVPQNCPGFERRPYHGSCHCGTVKYIAYLSLPTAEFESDGESLDIQSFREKSGCTLYKCNCTACHKMGFFHLRFPSAPDDFMLLSPGDPDAPGSGVSKYKGNGKYADWYFCTTCGVRCFTIFGKRESVQVESPSGSGCQERVTVWRPVKEGWKEGPDGNSYFSLNATTLDAGQEGFDLRKFHEKGWVAYTDSLDYVGEWRAGEPHRGGMY